MMSSVGETGAGGRNSKLINTNYSPYFIGSISSLVLDAKQILLVFKTNLKITKHSLVMANERTERS